MSQRTWIAPAKVNLTLKILGKRDDGFHELESLMVPLDFGDELHFDRVGEYRLRCDVPGVPIDETNLVTMAVRSFEQRTGRSCEWQIELNKQIPHGAGLGGGSSDAATVLLALNELEQAGLSISELADMGAEFGSDVPFFVYQQPCSIAGRGELVTPVDPGLSLSLKGQPMLLLKPTFGVSTPDAYKHCLNAELLHGVDYGPQPMPWGEVINDLERPVFYKHRFLAEMKVWLNKQADVQAAMMSGSGSTMIAFLHSEGQADSLLSRARQELDPTLWGKQVTII